MHMTLEGRNSLNVFRLARGVTALKEIEKTLYGNLVVIGIEIRKCYDTIDRHPPFSLDSLVRNPVY